MKVFNEKIKYFDEKHLNKKKIENFLLVQEEKKNNSIILKSMPYRYIIEPTNSCNLECPLCPTSIKFKDKKLKHMSFNEFKNIIDQIKDYALEVYLQNWGESTLNTELIKMIEYANQHNIFMYLSTNFSKKYTDDYLYRLIKSGLSILHIDLDGIDSEVYSQYRVGGDFNILINNITKIVKIKKELGLTYPIIKTHFMVMKHNEHQVEASNEFARNLGVDEHTIGNIQVNPATSSCWLPSNSQYVYKTYVDEVSSMETCNWLYSSMVLNSNGSISPCCIVFDEKANFGNVYKQDLKELRNDVYFQSARSVFNNLDQKIHTICAECKNMTHSKTLSRVGDTFSIKLKSTEMENK